MSGAAPNAGNIGKVATSWDGVWNFIKGNWKVLAMVLAGLWFYNLISGIPAKSEIKHRLAIQEEMAKYKDAFAAAASIKDDIKKLDKRLDASEKVQAEIIASQIDIRKKLEDSEKNQGYLANLAKQALKDQEKLLALDELKKEVDTIQARLGTNLRILDTAVPERKDIAFTGGQLRAENSLYAEAFSFKPMYEQTKTLNESNEKLVKEKDADIEIRKEKEKGLVSVADNYKTAAEAADSAAKHWKKIANQKWFGTMLKQTIPVAIVVFVVTSLFGK